MDRPGCFVFRVKGKTKTLLRNGGTCYEKDGNHVDRSRAGLYGGRYRCLGSRPAPPDEHRAVLQAVQALPAAYRDVVYLHYYEGYTAPEIARILGKNVNTIYTRLTRARGLLRQTLGGEADA